MFKAVVTDLSLKGKEGHLCKKGETERAKKWMVMTAVVFWLQDCKGSD